MVSPPIGWRVQFFENGNRNNPVCADVVETSTMGGMVKLNLQYPGGGESRSSRGFVRHANDPWLKTQEEWLRRNGNGFWDWMPGFVYEPGDELVAPREEAESKPEPRDEQRQSRKEQGLHRAKQLLAEGHTVEEALTSVKSYGVSRADVEKLSAEFAL